MVFKDSSQKIYLHFYDEYHKHPHTTTWTWGAFIMCKNLGICYLDQDENKIDLYKITNEKQWIFNKIKYGL